MNCPASYTYIYLCIHFRDLTLHNYKTWLNGLCKAVTSMHYLLMLESEVYKEGRWEGKMVIKFCEQNGTHNHINKLKPVQSCCL